MKNKKPLIMRIVLLILAFAIVLGLVISSFSSSLIASAAEPENSVEVEDFTTGNLRSAIESAKGSIDQNNIYHLTVLKGTLNSEDIKALQMLSNCKEINLENTNSEDGVFPDYVLSGRGSLLKVHMPKGIKRIGNGAFSGCGKLTEIVIPDSIEEIGNRAFEGCTALETITLPEKVVSIEECAFRGCSNLKEIILNTTNAPEIGSEVFPKSANIIIAEGAEGYEKWTDFNVEVNRDKSQIATVESVTETTLEEADISEASEVKAAEVGPAAAGQEKAEISFWKLAVTIVVCSFAAIGLSGVMLFSFKKIDFIKK